MPTAIAFSIEGECACCSPCSGTSLDSYDVPNDRGWETYVGNLRLATGGAIGIGLQCRNRGGVAELCGHSEFISPSTPPKKYRTFTASGSAAAGVFSNTACTTPVARVNWPNGVVVSGTARSVDADPTSQTIGGERVEVPFTFTFGPARGVNGRPILNYQFGPVNYTPGLAQPNVSMRLFLARFGAGSADQTNVGANGSGVSTGSREVSSTGYNPTVSSGVINWNIDMLVDVVGWRRVLQGSFDLGRENQTENWAASGVQTYDIGTCALSGALTLSGKKWDALSNAVVPFSVSATSAAIDADSPDGCSINVFTLQDGRTTSPTTTCCAVAAIRRLVTSCDLADTLSDEDTESDAIDRLLAGAGGIWTSWTTTGDGTAGTCIDTACCRAEYVARTAGFTFGYREAEWRISPTGNSADEGCYLVRVSYYRRAAGSGDPWVEYATGDAHVAIDASGNATLYAP